MYEFIFNSFSYQEPPVEKRPVTTSPVTTSSNYTVLPSISEEPSSRQSEVQNPEYKTSNFIYKPTPSPRSKPINIVDINLDMEKSSEVQNSSYISGGKSKLFKTYL